MELLNKAKWLFQIFINMQIFHILEILQWVSELGLIINFSSEMMKTYFSILYTK